jgi:hypothetical protein
MTTAIENEVKGAVKSFIHYVGLGWNVEESFEIAYDSVYDMIEKEAFLNRCQTATKEMNSQINN